MTATRIEPVSDLDALESDWRALGESAGNVFATWEWARTWWRHFGGGRELAAAVIRSNGQATAILPLYCWTTRPARVLRFLGHGAGDELGPIAAPASRSGALEALEGWLRETEGDWDVFLGENLVGLDGWTERHGARVLRSESNPVLVNPSGGWEAFLAGRSANFRQQVRRRERNLRRQHVVRIRLADYSASLESDLDVLFRLHEARWGERSSFGGVREPFQREFAQLALQRGWLRLWILELDDAPVAAWYGFRFDGVEAYYQAGRDPAFDRESVGFVLLAHSIRAAFDDGVREYRFLRGDDAYKSRFATADRPLQTVALSSGIRGRAAVAAASSLRASTTLRRTLRQRLGA